jgi:hypothetical protein
MISTASKDVVAIFEQETSSQLFVNARAIKAKVNETASIMSHPVEDGTTVSDHKVINPVEIELSCIIASSDYKTVYESIRNAFLNSTLLIVQTRSGTYRSMIISAMPHDEDPEMYESLAVAIKLIEVKFAKFTQGAKVSQPKNASHEPTQNGGKKQAKEENGTKKQSILYGWAE